MPPVKLFDQHQRSADTGPACSDLKVFAARIDVYEEVAGRKHAFTIRLSEKI
jgi:hypothetical protein